MKISKVILKIYFNEGAINAYSLQSNNCFITTMSLSTLLLVIIIGRSKVFIWLAETRLHMFMYVLELLLPFVDVF